MYPPVEQEPSIEYSSQIPNTPKRVIVNASAWQDLLSSSPLEGYHVVHFTFTWSLQEGKF